MSLLAHGDAGIINTWGFAYVGGIIGVFSVSLLYVKGKVFEGATADGLAGRRSGLAALGPGVIVVGGVCGISFGLGTASALDRLFVDDIEVTQVVADLCARRDDPVGADEALHDDIEHVVEDLDAEVAGDVHSEIHAGTASEVDLDVYIDRLVSELTSADGIRIASCDDLSRDRSDVDL